MARELSLLDRVRHPELEDRRSVDTDHGRLTRSVLRNLERLLNSRQGGASIRPDYGIPSIEDTMTAGSDGLRTLCAEIQSSIAAFEPRLHNVRVKVAPKNENDPTFLRFEILADLVTGGRKSRVRFETRLDESGRLAVKD